MPSQIRGRFLAPHTVREHTIGERLDRSFPEEVDREAHTLAAPILERLRMHATLDAQTKKQCLNVACELFGRRGVERGRLRRVRDESIAGPKSTEEHLEVRVAKLEERSRHDLLVRLLP